MIHAHASVGGKSGKLVKSCRCCCSSGHRLLFCVRCGHSSEFFRRWALACAVRRRIRILVDDDTSGKGDEGLPNGKTREDAFLGHDIGIVGEIASR